MAIPSGRAAALAAALLLIPAGARAQLNPFRGYSGPTLTQADRDASATALAQLLNDTPAVVGGSESWSNPASGASGAQTIERLWEREGAPCRTVRTSLRFPAVRERGFVLDYCFVDGRWRLL